MPATKKKPETKGAKGAKGAKDAKGVEGVEGVEGVRVWARVSGLVFRHRTVRACPPVL